MSSSYSDSPAILMKGVRRSFGTKPILKGVTAVLPPGKVVGLLGRNGEGKSTLFQILLDMLAADSGSIEVLGHRPDGSGAIRQLVGYIPERPVFHEFMTAGEAFALRRGFFKNWSDDKALALSRRLELDWQTKIRGASKGTLGKIAWVCAAAHDPRLFLLDEPTSGLDALVREDLLSHLIEELHESGKTILVANHHMEELAGVLDEIWVLSDGVIASIHDAETLRTQACRISGRLRAEGKVPDNLPLVDLPAEGPLVQWAFFEREAAEKIAAAGVLENMDVSPLPMNEALKMLLMKKRGDRHD